MTPLKTITIALTFFVSTVSSVAFADTSPADFTFSDDLTAAFEAHEADVEAFNDAIEAAIEGLDEDDTQDVFESYADEAEALRSESQALREEGVAEMEAEGLTPTPAGRDDTSSEDSSESESEGRNDRPSKGTRSGRH